MQAIEVRIALPELRELQKKKDADQCYIYMDIFISIAATIDIIVLPTPSSDVLCHIWQRFEHNQSLQRNGCRRGVRGNFSSRQHVGEEPFYDWRIHWEPPRFMFYYDSAITVQYKVTTGWIFEIS